MIGDIGTTELAPCSARCATCGRRFDVGCACTPDQLATARPRWERGTWLDGQRLRSSR